MSDLVDPHEIERIVGLTRSQTEHFGRAVDDVMYIMHSLDCLNSGIDLRDCEYSKAMDNDITIIPGGEGQPLRLSVLNGVLLGFRA